MQNENRLKSLYLIQELDLAVNTIKSGLAILQLGRPYKTQHFLFLLALSTGIERLMKVLLCLHEYDAHGYFLSESKLRSYSHNITKLKNDICQVCYAKRPTFPPAIEQDREFLISDSLLNAILEAMGDFALRDRYLYMDGINNPDSTREWIYIRWERIESMTISREEELRLIQNDELDYRKGKTTTAIVICLERFLRALARTVTHTGLKGQANSMGTGVWDFLTIKDKELGKTNYNVINV